MTPDGDAAPDGGDASTLPDGLTAPVLQNSAEVVYPPALVEQEVPPGGTVVVKYVVGIDGTTKEVEVVEGVHPEIDAAVVEAIAGLVYTPAMFEGEAVEFVLSSAIDVAPPEPEIEPEPEPPPKPEVEAPPEPAPPGPVRMRGKILEAGQRTPIEGALVTAYPAPGSKPGRVAFRKRKPPSKAPAWTDQATTDANGAFTLREVRNGRVRIVVMTEGFERFEYVVELRAGEVLEAKYFQVRMNTNPYRTEVETDVTVVPEVRRHKIKPEEVSKLPGTNGDALKAVQNFPGVARSPFGIGMISIRGAAPEDSSVYLGGHELPSLFHFGGLTSVFNSDLISEMTLVPGNFDSRYGNAIGGVVEVETRKGRRDGYHGYVKADVFDAAALVEGPVGKGSFAASIRRSYIDAILPAVIPDDAGLNFSLAPRYYDYSGLFDYPVAGGTLTARVLGSDDRMNLIFGNANDDNPDARTGVATTIWFHRADLAYEKKWNKWNFLITPSYRRDWFALTLQDQFRFEFLTDRFSGRAEVTRQIGERSALRFGADIVSDWTQVDIRSPPVQQQGLSSRGGAGPSGGVQLAPVASKMNLFTARPALYSTLRWGITPRFDLSPGFRLTYIEGPRDGVTIDPRVSFKVAATDRTTVTGGVGVYSQRLNDATNSSGFGNPNLKPDQSVHASLGVRQEFGQDWSVSATGYFKYLWSLAAPSPDIIDGPDGQQRPELFDNSGIGRIYGGEFMLRKEMTRKLYGWVSYSASRSEIRQRPGDEFQPFDFDQTHILTLLAAYRLPRNWQIGARFRLISGNPYTPTTDGVAQLREGFHFPLAGEYNSARMRAFHQLDLRVDKSWVFRLVKLNVYLDVQNVYNAKNPEFLLDSWNYQQRTSVNSLPIIPSVGLKLEW